VVQSTSLKYEPSNRCRESSWMIRWWNMPSREQTCRAFVTQSAISLKAFPRLSTIILKQVGTSSWNIRVKCDITLLLPLYHSRALSDTTIYEPTHTYTHTHTLTHTYTHKHTHTHEPSHRCAKSSWMTRWWSMTSRTASSSSSSASSPGQFWPLAFRPQPYLYALKNTYTCIYMHVYVYIHIYEDMNIYIYIFIYIYKYIYVHI
jgi:hypothetical protein